MSTAYYSNLDQTNLADFYDQSAFQDMKKVEKIFPFVSNDYYLSLMNHDNPSDPIRNIILPDIREIMSSGSLDPSQEESYTILPGVQHKYPQTVLLLVSNTCAGICRFCFRKRIFCGKKPPELCDIKKTADYLQTKPEVTDVLLSGGDPFMLSPSRLDEILSTIREISHIPIIRIGTKVPAYDPERICETPDISEVVAQHSHPNKKIYLISHFNHPREVTPQAEEAIMRIKGAGAEMVNQTPILNAINGESSILEKLLKKLTALGVSPYYFFQCRPTCGNTHHAIPVERTLQIIHEAQSHCSGTAKRARFILSHYTGKIEVVGSSRSHIYMRYHQKAPDTNLDTIITYKKNPDALWFDDYRNQMNEDVNLAEV